MGDTTEKKATEPQEQTRAGARAAAAGMTDSTQRAAAAADQASRAGGAAMRAGAGAVAETARRGAEVGEETMRHMSGAFGAATRQSGQTWAQGQQNLFDSAAEQMHETAHMMTRALQESAEGIRSLMIMPRLTGDGIEDMHHGMERLISGVIETNMRSAQEMLRMGHVGQFVSLQQRFMREYLDTLAEGSAVLVRSVRRAADQTLRPFEQQLEQRCNGRGMGADGRNDRVSDVMDREPRIASPEDTVQQATRIMRDSDTGALPVGEGDRLVGMITDRDVAVRLIAEGRDPARTKVREVMTPEVRYVFEDEDMGHVADNMAEQQVRRMPVVNRAKRLVGVVSLSDFARKGRRDPLAGRALAGIAREGGQHTQTAAE